MPEHPRHSWWQTLPGVLTGIAAVITAITGLAVAVVQITSGDPPRSDRDPAAVVTGAETTRATGSKAPGGESSSGAAGDQAPAAGGEVQSEAAKGSASRASRDVAWADVIAVITTRHGETRVRAETLSNCISVNHAISLGTGQDIPFERMRALEVLSADPREAPNARAVVRVTLLDGSTTQGSVPANCDLFGYNELGRFATYFQDLKRIDFVGP